MPVPVWHDPTFGDAKNLAERTESRDQTQALVMTNLSISCNSF